MADNGKSRGESVAVRVCSRCVCDTTISSIQFDEKGECNFCKSHDRMALQYPRNEMPKRLETLVSQIKNSGKGKEHDCICGVSGGTDSSYTLWLAKKLGLRPLAVHFDNGWNTDQSVTNVRRITSKLDVDLHTYVVEWEEFKDLQLSFLKASVPCIEAPTDVAIHAVLFKLAAEEGIKFILGGQSFMTEGTVPREWSYLDGTYVRAVQAQFGSVPLKSYPNLTLPKIAGYTFVRGIRNIPFLNYVDYNKAEAKKLLAGEFDWQDYGGHHYENIYSRFAFGWYLPKKFGIDKRKISLSGPIRSGQITRESALRELSVPPPVEDEIVDYCINKLGISRNEFDRMMAAPNKTYRDYPTSERLLRHFRVPVRMAVKMKIFTPVLYEKYFT